MRTVALVIFFILGASVPNTHALPFGDPAWAPSPTDPVGFAGQWNGWYPGATPPMAFGEGTVTNAKVKVESRRRRDGYFSLSGPYDAERSLPVYADNQARNIRWKMPTPGWSTSQPVVIGKRVVTTHSPHYVVCWDTETGKVMWRDELKAMLLPKLAADRKSLTPAPSDAAKLQHLHELGLAVFRLGFACQPGLHKTILDVDDRKALLPLFDAAIAGLEALRKDVPAEALPAFEKEIEEFKAGKAASAASMEEAGKFRLGSFPAFVAKTTGIPLHNCWPGWQISDTIATPVSDGQIVCVQFGHGQVAAYEVATGRQLWAFRDPTVQATSVSHAPSPILWKDTLIVNAGGGKAQNPTLLALDKKSGAVLWENAGGVGGCRMGASHGDHMPHHLLRLGGRALIVSNKGAVLEAETGKVFIEKLPGLGGRNEGLWGSGYIGSIGDLVLKTWGGDCSPPPCESWQLKVTGNEVTATARPSFAFPTSHGPWAISDRVMVGAGKLVDPTTGQVLATVPRGTPSIAGKYLVIAEDLNHANGRDRQDRLCLAKFSIVDVTEPTKPVTVSQNNYLGTAAMPVDIADTFFPAVAKNPELKALTLGGYHGVASVFGVMMSGVTAHGDRLFILSQTHLYCVGSK
jgi:outer membrane protein assembly factor BamB